MIDKITKLGRKLFHSFLSSQKAEENLDFLDAVEQLSDESGRKKMVR